jgi:pimeloyl-ACP methyl ester carboxylesterase
MTEVPSAGYVDASGARIYYEVDGAGEPVLLIHAGVANLRMWDAQVDALRGSFRVIRYDTRGFGRTQTQAVEFSNRDDIAAVLDAVGARSAHIVGLSRGGVIALDFALEFPDRVRSLAVAGSGIGGYESPDDAPASTWEAAERLIAARDWNGIADWETAYWADGPGQPIDRLDPRIRATVHDWILTNYQAEKEEGQPRPLTPPAIERLRDLRAPLLVMIGTLDDAGVNESCRHLADIVPDAQLEVFEGAAHMMNLEQPDRFNRVLRSFLEANVAPPARPTMVSTRSLE